MKTGNSIIFLTAVLIILAAQGCKQMTNVTLVFNSIGISLEGFEDFTVNEDNENRLAMSSNGIILTVKLNRNMGKKVADSLVSEKSAILEAQYEIRDAPYPGEITKEVVCPEEYKPIKNIVGNKHSLANYRLHSTKSFTYGACASDLVAYNSFLGFFYCDGKGLYQLELFVPVDEEGKFEEMLEKISSFDC